MGFFDRISAALCTHQSGESQLGSPMTLKNAKALLTNELLEQPLSDMKLTAQRAKRLNDEMPEFTTFAMSHYFNTPRLVRYANEGGKQIDADAISRLFAAPWRPCGCRLPISFECRGKWSFSADMPYDA